MVTIHLDAKKEKQLRELAGARGEDAATLLRRVVEDYLDMAALPVEDPDQADRNWSESSVAMTPQIMDDESWDEGDGDGSR